MEIRYALQGWGYALGGIGWGMGIAEIGH